MIREKHFIKIDENNFVYHAIGVKRNNDLFSYFVQNIFLKSFLRILAKHINILHKQKQYVNRKLSDTF